jgi:flavin-dependent dehydrogenase
LPDLNRDTPGIFSRRISLEREIEKDHRITIVGGGFGGLATARALRSARAHVLLIDKSNHHLFQPLLYQVATATLARQFRRLSNDATGNSAERAACALKILCAKISRSLPGWRNWQTRQT